jgi:hypothetical protein
MLERVIGVLNGLLGAGGEYGLWSRLVRYTLKRLAGERAVGTEVDRGGVGGPERERLGGGRHS